jgi:hypothetical protein
MRDDDWLNIMLELLDGIERELPSNVSNAIPEKLSILRNRIINKKKSASRKNIEREVDAFLESTPFLLDCSDKYIVKKLGPALDQAEDVLRRTDAIFKNTTRKTEPNQRLQTMPRGRADGARPLDASIWPNQGGGRQ